MNSIRRFLFKDFDVRGQHLSLESAWQALNQDRGYSQVVRTLFGELSALGVMLANGIKHQGKLTLQIQGDGAINLMLVEITHDLKIRGMVRTQSAVDEQAGIDEIFGKSLIVATLYNSQTDNSFQSIVPRNPKGLIQTFEDYFASSEQLESKIWVASSKEKLGAILLQKMPQSERHHPEDWSRVNTLTQTTTDEELLTLDSESILHRLFHQEVVELFDEEPVVYECPQDKSRLEQVIANLGEQQARELLDENGEIAIHNEICNTHVFFNQQDLDRIFNKSST